MFEEARGDSIDDKLLPLRRSVKLVKKPLSPCTRKTREVMESTKETNNTKEEIDDCISIKDEEGVNEGENYDCNIYPKP